MPTIPADAVYHSTAEPDPEPGHYYVTIIDGRRYAKLAGPYLTHQQALAQVEPAKAMAYTLNSREAAFAGFGTAKVTFDDGVTPPPGILHQYGFPLPLLPQ